MGDGPDEERNTGLLQKAAFSGFPQSGTGKNRSRAEIIKNQSISSKKE